MKTPAANTAGEALQVAQLMVQAHSHHRPLEAPSTRAVIQPASYSPFLFHKPAFTSSFLRATPISERPLNAQRSDLPNIFHAATRRRKLQTPKSKARTVQFSSLIDTVPEPNKVNNEHRCNELPNKSLLMNFTRIIQKQM